MGVDLAKLPSEKQLREMLMSQMETSLERKQSYALIWEFHGSAIGHCNVNQIEFGKQAFMHLHLWNSEQRQRGLGTHFIKKSLPFFFEKLELDLLYCEPYALNEAPNKTLERLGFQFVKSHTTIPGSLNFEQEVNRWSLTKAQFQSL